MTELSNLVAESVERLRRDKPLVQCLTNIVVANFTANVLLSAGAVPAMVDNPEGIRGIRLHCRRCTRQHRNSLPGDHRGHDCCCARCRKQQHTMGT